MPEIYLIYSTFGKFTTVPGRTVSRNLVCVKHTSERYTVQRNVSIIPPNRRDNLIYMLHILQVNNFGNICQTIGKPVTYLILRYSTRQFYPDILQCLINLHKDLNDLVPLAPSGA
jgi:hypothetical protein